MRPYRIDLLTDFGWTPLAWGDGFDTVAQTTDVGQRLIKYPGIFGYRVVETGGAQRVVTSVENPVVR